MTPRREVDTTDQNSQPTLPSTDSHDEGDEGNLAMFLGAPELMAALKGAVVDGARNARRKMKALLGTVVTAIGDDPDWHD